MFFKKLRTKSSSQSTKPSITRIASTSSSTQNGTQSKVPDVTISPPPMAPLGHAGKSVDDEAREYQEFLEKARKDAEKAERKRLREIEAARQVNMSPWASRM